MKKVLGIALEQVTNSAIVAGITALSLMATAQAVSSKAIGVAFGLAFLIEMRRYRKLNG